MNEPPKKNFFCPDNIFQNTPLPMLKILLPFLPVSSQKYMAVLLKFLELKYTIDFFNRGNFFYSLTDSFDPSNPVEMMSVLKDIFPKEQQENIDNMFQMVQAMEMMQSLQDDDTGSNPVHSETSGINPGDMFQIFSGMFPGFPEDSANSATDTPDAPNNANNTSPEPVPSISPTKETFPEEMSLVNPIDYEQ